MRKLKTYKNQEIVESVGGVIMTPELWTTLRYYVPELKNQITVYLDRVAGKDEYEDDIIQTVKIPMNSYKGSYYKFINDNTHGTAYMKLEDFNNLIKSTDLWKEEQKYASNHELNSKEYHKAVFGWIS